jgi:hypothetical protein
LRLRFEEAVGESLEKADDLFLVSYLLPQQAEFISEESSYREAVEYLVQIKLRDIRGDLVPNFNVISKVKYIDRASSLLLERYANEIVTNFKSNYS